MCLFGNWKVLIFFLFPPAGNVLLTEDGTVKLGKAWHVTFYIIFPCTACTYYMISIIHLFYWGIQEWQWKDQVVSL